MQKKVAHDFRYDPRTYYQLGLNLLATGRLAIPTAIYLSTKLFSYEDWGGAEDLNILQHRYENIILRKAKNFRPMLKPLSTWNLCTPVVVNFKESHTVQIQQIIYVIARNNPFSTLKYEFNVEPES